MNSYPQQDLNVHWFLEQTRYEYILGLAVQNEEGALFVVRNFVPLGFQVGDVPALRATLWNEATRMLWKEVL